MCGNVNEGNGGSQARLDEFDGSFDLARSRARWLAYHYVRVIVRHVLQEHVGGRLLQVDQCQGSVDQRGISGETLGNDIDDRFEWRKCAGISGQ